MYIYDGKFSHMHRRMCYWNYTQSINHSLVYKAKEERHVRIKLLIITVLPQTSGTSVAAGHLFFSAVSSMDLRCSKIVTRIHPLKMRYWYFWSFASLNISLTWYLLSAYKRRNFALNNIIWLPIYHHLYIK